MKKIILSLFLLLCVGFPNVIAQTDLELNAILSPVNLPSDSCHSTNDSIVLLIVNTGNTALDFTVDTLDIEVNVTGITQLLYSKEINDNSLNSGLALAVGDSMKVNLGNIDLSSAGVYKFKAIINLNISTNTSNDTLIDSLTNSQKAGKIFGMNTICGDDTARFKLVGSTGAVQWQRLVSSVFVDETVADSILYEVYLDSSTTFRALVCGTEVSDTFSIIREELPLLPSVLGDTSVVRCGDSTELIFTATSLYPNSSFFWYRDSLEDTPLSVRNDVLYLSPNGDSIKFKYGTSIINGLKDTLYVEESYLSKQSCYNDTLTVIPFTGSYSCAAGNMFDVVGINNIQIDGFAINSYQLGNQMVKVYIKKGTYINSIQNVNDWTLIDSVEVFGNGNGKPSYLELSETINLSSMDTLGIYILFKSNYSYANRGTVYENNDLQVIVGHGFCSPFTFGNNDRGFNGQILYSKKTKPRIPVVGIVECIPYTDLSISSLNKPVVGNTRCSTGSSEAVELVMKNMGGLDVDFTTDSVEIVVNVSGALTQTMGYTINNNLLNGGNPLAPGESINIQMGNINMSNIGNYAFETYLNLPSDTFPLNDTLYLNVSNVVSGGSITVEADTVCGTQTVIMQASNSVGTLQWQRLIGNTFVDEANADSSFFEVNIDSTTSFRVISCGAAVSDTIMLDYFSLPSIPRVEDDTISICGNIGRHGLTASSSLSGSRFNWYADAFNKNILFTGDTFYYMTHPTFFPETIIDTFYVALVDSLSKCESPRVMVQGTINFIGPIPQVNLGNDTIICKSSPLRLDTDLGLNNYKYRWNTGHRSDTIIPSLAYDSLYIVKVMDKLGCTATDSIIVEIDTCLHRGAYLFEDFNAGIPILWKDSIVSGTYNWMLGSININNYNGIPNNDTTTNIDGTGMIYFNDDSLGSSNLDNTVIMITPVIDVRSKSKLLLEFDYNFKDYVAIQDSFIVHVYDGNDWKKVFHKTKKNSFSNWKPLYTSPHAKIDISQYSNKDLRVKFTYYDGNDWGYWAALDNVLIHHPHRYYPIDKVNKVDSMGMADSLNGEYWISGTVAGIDFDGGNALSFTLIDLSSGKTEGINVYSPTNVSNYTVHEGDSILLMGELSQMNGLQQFIPDSIQLISSGHSLPVSVLVETLNESTESQLIRIENLEVTAIGSVNPNGFKLGLTDGSNNYTAFIDSDTDIDDSLNFSLGQTICSINGIGGQVDSTYPYTSGYNIVPMSYMDVAFGNSSIDLGKDTITCDTAILLDAGPGFVTYHWNTGDSTQTILATSLTDSLYIVTAKDSLGCVVRDSIIAKIDFCMDIAQENSINALKIYPNPSKGVFHIEGSMLKGQKQIKVFNSKAQLVYESELGYESNFNKQIDISSFSKGIYLIKFFSRDYMHMQKIVIQ